MLFVVRLFFLFPTSNHHQSAYYHSQDLMMMTKDYCDHADKCYYQPYYAPKVIVLAHGSKIF